MRTSYTCRVPSQARTWVGPFALAAAFLLPILATVALYLPGGLLMPARLVTLLLAGIAVAQFLFRREPLPRGVCVAVGTVCGVFVVCGVVGALRFPGASSVEVATVFFLLLGLAASLVLSDRLRFVGALIAGWEVSAALAAAVAIWEIVTARHLPLSVGTRSFEGVEHWNEITSFFDNPNLYAYHCVVALLLLPMAWELLGRSRWRWVLPVQGLLLAGLLLRSHGQMAFMAFGLGMVWWCLRSRWGRVALLGGFVTVAGTMALRLPPGWNLYRFVEVALDGLQWEDKSTYIRAHLVQTGWWISERTGFLGAGPGGFERMALDEANPHRSTGFSNAHWGMIEVLVNYGAPTLVVLLAALAAGVVWSVRSARRLRIGGDPAGAAVMFGAGVLAVTLPVVSMSHSTWLVQPLTSVHLMILVAAFTVGGRRLGKLEESGSDD